MGRKKINKEEGLKPNDNWVFTTEIVINGKNISEGVELSIYGEVGRFRFIRHVTTEKGHEWIDVIGGPKGYNVYRSFKVDKIEIVYAKNKTDKNIIKEKKEAVQKELERQQSKL